ncbi:acyltransferase [Methylobacterium sp. NEAU K]|uniref:acyltransferase family protein n=1 Tax=Methylobacterium sp. NEAU K TaxID=3064946 RepID=UPI002734DE8B|nr:acyltransferase [Methylobacterium sp. NEAU K]MDP4005021.1 acyltransferase [Methylobacterium sp. NEAU K]
MPPRHLPVLDGWRGCAILLVLVGHFGTTRWINLGRFGVELFFVLSGRLMAEILFERATPIKTFFIRRAARIYPALIFFILSMIALHFAQGDGQHIYGYVSALSLTYNYYHIWFPEVPIVDHVWSLCVEEHTYILLGIVALLWRRFQFPVFQVIAGLAALACLDGLVSSAIGQDYTIVYWRSDVRAASILFGAAAYLRIRQSEATGRYPAFLPALLLPISLLLNLNVVPDQLKYSLGSLLLAVSVALIPSAPAFLRKRLVSTPLVLFGLWSYSIYLWQQPFYVLHESLNDGISKALVVPAITTGILSLLLIERPLREYLNRILAGSMTNRKEGVSKSYATP